MANNIFMPVIVTAGKSYRVLNSYERCFEASSMSEVSLDPQKMIPLKNNPIGQNLAGEILPVFYHA